MTRLSVSAPGKLVLLGEYAVLFGHAAVVLAVDRRATVELTSAAGRNFCVHAPGIVPERARFGLGDGATVAWENPSGARLPLVEAVLGALLAGGVIDPRLLEPFDAVLDTRAFFDSTTGSDGKLGLGSSAALTVALASAVALWSGREDLLEPRIEWLERLLRIHREFQGGRGSGIDLAASLFSLCILGQRDMRFLWGELDGIARRHGAVCAGDTACGFGNTAMVLAEQKMIPRVFAAVVRAVTAVRSLVAYECGAVGPGKDCGYENPILKAITGYPMAMEGRTRRVCAFQPTRQHCRRHL